MLLAESLKARLDAHQPLSLVCGTMRDMDARNFGTANQRLDEAAAAFAQVDPNALGPAATELEDLRRAMAKRRIRVAEDLAGQRGIVAELPRQPAFILDA